MSKEIIYVIVILFIMVGVYVAYKFKDEIADLIRDKMPILLIAFDFIKLHLFHIIMLLTFVGSLLGILLTYTSKDVIEIDGMIHEVSKMIFSVVVVTILLSINRFLPVVKKAMKSFYMDKDFLKDLSVEELKSHIKFINGQGNHFKIEDENRKKNSIASAKRVAIKNKEPYFLHSAEITKAIYPKGLEMTIIRNKVEILINGVFVMNHTLSTDNNLRMLPGFEDFLGDKNRFVDYTFKAEIFEFFPKNKVDNTPKFSISKLKSPPFTAAQKKIFSETVKEDTNTTKKLSLQTTGKLKKGDIFIVEVCLSLPEERVEGADKPSISFTKPAGIRKIRFQDDCFNPKKGLLDGGTLTINNKDKDESKDIIHNIFYKKIEWEIYYDEVSKIKKTEEFPLPIIKLEIH